MILDARYYSTLRPRDLIQRVYGSRENWVATAQTIYARRRPPNIEREITYAIVYGVW